MSWGRVVSFHVSDSFSRNHYKERVVQDICMKSMAWLKDRISEPSSWASVAAALLGLGTLFSSGVLVMAAVLVAVLGFVLKEKGLI